MYAVRLTSTHDDSICFFLDFQFIVYRYYCCTEHFDEFSEKFSAAFMFVSIDTNNCNLFNSIS